MSAVDLIVTAVAARCTKPVIVVARAGAGDAH